MTLNLPEDVKRIISRLTREGYEAYAVGGCVRDAILGRVPMDWDITTSAKPETVKSLFSHTIDTGIQHGTVTVMMNHVGYEVTTYRIDGEYEDCRHPKEVIFTTQLSEDLLRRDFTINAMAYNNEQGIVDLFSGAEDLERGVIRCVGEASERFDEDALRILRAFRFSAQLGFSIDAATIRAAAERVDNLSKVSAERIRVELNKLLHSNNPDRLLDAFDSGVTGVVFHEFDHSVKINRENVLRTLLAVKAVGATNRFNDKQVQILKWATLLSRYAADRTAEGISKEDIHLEVRGIMSRLRFDNETRDAVTHLCDCTDLQPYDNSDKSMRSFLHKIGPDYHEMLFEMQKAKSLAFGFGKEEAIEASRLLAEKIIERNDCVSVKQLAITGTDLIDAGLEKGPRIGKVLDMLLEKVLNDQSLNDRQKLIEIALNSDKN